MKLRDIAAALGGQLVGNGDLDIARPVHPAAARSAADLAIATDPKLVPLLHESAARVAVVADGVVIPEGVLDAWVTVGRPRYAMAGVTELFQYPVILEAGIHPSAVVAADAVIGDGARIGPLVYVGPGAHIGARTILMPQVTVGAGTRIGCDGLVHSGARIGDRVTIGDRVILHFNASIGADGFSFVTPERGSVESAKATGRVESQNLTLRRIHSLGAVTLGDDVEVGANTAIDRGTLSDTRVGSGTKIDNLVQIGHNVQIGMMCMICGEVGIAGSVTVGNRVVLAGKVGIADHVAIGDDTVVGAYAGVAGDIPPRSVVLGQPAMPRSRFFEQLKHLGRLRALFADMGDIKKRVSVLEER